MVRAGRLSSAAVGPPGRERNAVDTMTINKVVASLLVALLLIRVSSMLSESVFEVEAPEHPAYAVALPENTASEAAAEAAPAKEAAPTLAELLAGASPDKGKRVFAKCMACHSVNPADGNKVGPNLHNVVGAPVAHRDDFNYSDALKSHGGTWTYELLDHWVRNPKETIPGNKMAFGGISKPEDRASLIAFLRANTENPPPLPTATASVEGEATP